MINARITATVLMMLFPACALAAPRDDIWWPFACANAPAWSKCWATRPPVPTPQPKPAEIEPQAPVLAPSPIWPDPPKYEPAPVPMLPPVEPKPEVERRPPQIAKTKPKSPPLKPQARQAKRPEPVEITCAEARKGVGMPCWMIRMHAGTYEAWPERKKRQARACLTEAERTAIAACFKQ